MVISAVNLPATDTLLVTLANGATVDIAPALTPPPTPPTPVQPTPTPVGTVVRLPGVPVFDQQGNAYALTANPGQIAWSAWSASTGQAAPVTVTSSAQVIFLQVVGPTATDPSGVVQGNTSGELWGVAQGNAPGADLGPIPGTKTPPATIPYTPGKNPFGAMFGTPVLEIDDWTQPIATRTLEGSSTTWATTIPSPGGGMRNEPENPEREYYAGPADAYDPFTLNADGSVTITARQGGVNGVPATPDAAHDYWSGVLSSAGSGGTVCGIGYGLISILTFWDELADIWPADWLIPIDNNFDYTGEIDILEYWQLLSQYHCGLAGGSNNGFQPNPVGNYKPTDPHHYSVYWNETFCAFYLDGVLMVSYPTPSGLIGKTLVYMSNLAVGSNNSWVDQPPMTGSEVLTKTNKQFVYYAPPA